jgi:erythromycin esterase-like protein
MGYLRKHDPGGLEAARRAYQCFEPYGEDEQQYARATHFGGSCEDEVIALLAELRRKAAGHDGDGRDGAFEAEQNALVVKNAEAYYRVMVRGGPESWSVRDRHMADTLARLLARHGPRARAREGSWEDVLHRACGGDRLFVFDDAALTEETLRPRGHRAIGVVYHPDYEFGNYVPTVLPRRYEAFVYLDETQALRPLHLREPEAHEVPETYPSGV